MKKKIIFILCFFVASLLFAQNNSNDEIIVNQDGLFSSEQIIATTDGDGNMCLGLLIIDKLDNHAYGVKACYHNDDEKEAIKSKMIELIMYFEDHTFTEDIESKILLYAHKYKTTYAEVDQQAYRVKTYIWN